MSVGMSITEAEISSLVDRFYAKVQLDPEIGPVFHDAIHNWDAHLALLKDFWSTVLLATGKTKAIHFWHISLCLSRKGTSSGGWRCFQRRPTR
jgi:hypothetical protein